MSRWQQGKYIPLNPEKYNGNVSMIFWRSSWERRVMCFFDKTPEVLSWSSEETIIPYQSPIDNKIHRYFVDFKCKIKSRTGIKEYLIEVKPYSQTIPPINFSGRKRKSTLIKEQYTYAVNVAKWTAAKSYCKDRGIEFLILTEKELGIK